MAVGLGFLFWFYLDSLSFSVVFSLCWFFWDSVGALSREGVGRSAIYWRLSSLLNRRYRARIQILLFLIVFFFQQGHLREQMVQKSSRHLSVEIRVSCWVPGTRECAATKDILTLFLRAVSTQMHSTQSAWIYLNEQPFILGQCFFS